MLWVLGWTCAAASASVTVQTQSGYDSNPFYNSPAVLSDLQTSTGAPDGLFEMWPRATGEVSHGAFRLTAGYQLRFTQYFTTANGFVLLHQAVVDGTYRLGRYDVGVTASGDDYAISAFRSDRSRRGNVGLLGGVTLGTLRLGLEASYGARLFPQRYVDATRTETDKLQTVSVSAAWDLGELRLGAQLQFENQMSNAVTLVGDWELGTFTARWATGNWRLDGALELRRLHLLDYPVEGGTGRLDSRVAARVQAGLAMGRWMPFVRAGAEANYSLVLNEYRRYDVEAGLQFTFAVGSDVAPSGVPLPVPGRPTGRYRFEIDVPNARVVRITGTFTRWSKDGLLLVQSEPGRFAIELELQPGRYRYQLIADGLRVTPTQAAALEPDGMGGLNGVLVVPNPETSEFAQDR
jgi:hypothetical protein